MTSPEASTGSPAEQRRLGVLRPSQLTGVVIAAIGVVSVSAGLAQIVLDLPTDVVELAAEVVLATLAVALVRRLRCWRGIGFRPLTTLRDLRLFWIPLFPVLPALPAAVAALAGQGTSAGIGRLGFWLAVAALVGFVEETAFRGLILRALAPRGVRRAAVVSSVLFGSMHVVNLLFGADLGATLLQVGYATAMGFTFAAVALRTGVIWPLVVIHTLMDAVGFVTADGTTSTVVGGADVLVAGVYAAMFTVYGALVLRTGPRTVRITPGPATATARDPLAGSPVPHEVTGGRSG